MKLCSHNYGTNAAAARHQVGIYPSRHVPGIKAYANYTDNYWLINHVTGGICKTRLEIIYYACFKICKCVFK